MGYLCVKQLTAGKVTYHPGEPIPDGVILPKRSGKLLKSGYISEINEKTGEILTIGSRELFTREEVDAMVAEALAGVEKEQAERLEYTAELKETDPGAYDGVIPVTVKGAADGEFIAVCARPEEIQQVFSIMRLSAEEGARAIAEVKNENVLILLHEADSRKTIKNAAREQADKLSAMEDVPDRAHGDDGTGNSSAKGVEA